MCVFIIENINNNKNVVPEENTRLALLLISYFPDESVWQEHKSSHNGVFDLSSLASGPRREYFMCNKSFCVNTIGHFLDILLIARVLSELKESLHFTRTSCE